MTTIRTEAFDLAWRFVTETNLNLFLTGKAGTGKTTFLKYLRKNSFKKMVVAAPTGIAAINAGGVTLHSFFQLPFGPYLPVKDLLGNYSGNPSLLGRLRYNGEKLGIIRSLELLVIDEASMVAAHTVDAIDAILRHVRRRPNLPFGGVQVLFIGDLHQLQPVVKNEEWALLRDTYNSIFFFDSMVLKQNPPVMVELKEIFRQRDASFIEILNEIRHNTLTEKNLQLLNTRLKPGFRQELEEGYITLTTHNSQADEINRRTMESLEGKSRTFRAQVEGDFPESQYPAENELVLKKGAQVMFIKNDTEGKQYFNGKIGVVDSLDIESVWVRCKAGSKGEEDELIEVERQEWANVTYSLDPGTHAIEEEQKGTFRQYPLRLAWALTIHKSQGLTFEKLVIDAEKAFANGQVYVALSRCTSLEGLILTSPISRKFLGAHNELKYWQEKHNDESALPQKLSVSRRVFLLKELHALFSFGEWGIQLKELQTALQAAEDDASPEWETWLEDLLSKLRGMDAVGQNFRNRISTLVAEPGEPEQNETFQERIRSGSQYFHAQVMDWYSTFRSLPFRIKTRKAAYEIEESLAEINFILHECLQRLTFLQKGFYLESWLKEGKQVSTGPQNLREIYVRETTPQPFSSHPELYLRLSNLRKELADGKKLYSVFSNKALTGICEALPESREALVKVKGIGNKKVMQFGDAILDIVREYKEEKGLNGSAQYEPEPEQHDPETVIAVRKPAKAGDTVGETVSLFKGGHSPAEIAEKRGLVLSTIETHLAKAIENGLISIDELMPAERVKEIAGLIPEEELKLAELKELMPEGVTYGEIKWVLAGLGRR